HFEGNVMVTGPRPDPSGPDLSFLGPDLVPYAGLGYLAFGIPFATLFLWLWLGEQGVLAPPWAPDPSVRASVEQFLTVRFDALSLVISFVFAAAFAGAGGGLLARREWGRKALLSC